MGMCAAQQEQLHVAMIDRILVAYDNSETSAKAFAYAIDLLEALRGSEESLELLFVARLPPGSAEYPAASKEIIRAAEADFGLLRKKAEIHGIKFDVYELGGFVAEDIAISVEEGHFDLVVLGHHHHSLLARLFSPSIAKATIDVARCPTLVVY